MRRLYIGKFNIKNLKPKKMMIIMKGDYIRAVVLLRILYSTMGFTVVRLKNFYNNFINNARKFLMAPDVLFIKFIIKVFFYSLKKKIILFIKVRMYNFGGYFKPTY